jgi:hypothetical protein
MKTFRDSNQIVWTVFEVRRQVASSGDESYLPRGYSDGWLCFECAAAKRRLVRYPARWRELAEEELARLLDQAQPAPRGALRLGDDLGDGSTSPDFRPD